MRSSRQISTIRKFNRIWRIRAFEERGKMGALFWMTRRGWPKASIAMARGKVMARGKTLLVVRKLLEVACDETSNNDCRSLKCQLQRAGGQRTST